MTRDQTTAPQTLLPAGVPRKSERMASTTIVKGLTSAKVWRAPGIDSTGTKAEETKVSGKMNMKPSDCADSVELAVRPTKAKTQEKAYPKSSRRRMPATMW